MSAQNPKSFAGRKKEPTLLSESQTASNACVAAPRGGRGHTWALLHTVQHRAMEQTLQAAAGTGRGRNCDLLLSKAAQLKRNNNQSTFTHRGVTGRSGGGGAEGSLPLPRLHTGMGAQSCHVHLRANQPRKSTPDVSPAPGTLRSPKHFLFY